MLNTTEAPLPQLEQHRRDCEVRYWFRNKDLDAFLTWGAKKPEDYRRRVALLVANEVLFWVTVTDAFRRLTDLHRDLIEPFVKQAWEEHGNGKHTDARFESGRRPVQATR